MADVVKIEIPVEVYEAAEQMVAGTSEPPEAWIGRAAMAAANFNAQGQSKKDRVIAAVKAVGRGRPRDFRDRYYLLHGQNIDRQAIGSYLALLMASGHVARVERGVYQYVGG